MRDTFLMVCTGVGMS